MPKKSNGIGIYLAVLLVILLVASMLMNMMQTQPSTLKYTEVMSYFQQDRVQAFSFDMGNGELKITTMDGEEADITYQVPHIGLFLQDVQPLVLQHNETNPDSLIVGDYIKPTEIPWWVTGLLPSLLLLGLMVAFWVIMMRQSRGGGGAGVAGFGRTKVRNPQDTRKVTFADVAGIDEEMQELMEVVDFLRNPGKFNALGARIPKGILLVGPPGTGKTLLARAVAGEAGVQFFSISGSDFVELYVGVGASRMRDLFEQAKKSAPSMIFIDEIDAAGRQRGTGIGGGHDEREQTLNQLLVEMDGFSANTGVIVMGATNRSDVLDPALIRPGRFDRQVYVGYPDVKGREEILKIHVRGKPLGPDVDLKGIARATVGFTGADLENAVNEAAILAARRNLRATTMQELEESIIKVQMGPEKKSRVITDEDKVITAHHEAGHAICSLYSPTQDPVHEISIIPRGMAAGYTMSRPEEDRGHISKNYMYESLVVLLGGRVAEELTQSDVCTGASNDLERATQIARDMVTRYGFSDKVGPVVYGRDEASVFLGRDYGNSWSTSEAVSAQIDGEVRSILERAYNRTTEIISTHLDQLKKVADYLIEKEKMDGEQFKALVNGTTPIDKPNDFFQSGSIGSNPLPSPQ